MNTKKRNIDKAYKAMHAVLKRGRLHNLSIKCQYDLFDKIVKPIISYGCERVRGAKVQNWPHIILKNNA